MKSDSSPHLAGGILPLAGGAQRTLKQRRPSTLVLSGAAHLVVLLTLMTLAGRPVTAQTSPAWPTYPSAEVPADLQAAARHGDLIIVSLQGALLSELRRELGAGGPAQAMASCHIDAGAAAYRAAREPGVAAGRTSARLRNPTNAPKPWAAAIVARYADQPSAKVAGFVVDLGDRVGVLRPILEQPMCASCHGSEEQLSARVRAELADRYPADRATGFRDGDIRGWFWVEVPRK